MLLFPNVNLKILRQYGAIFSPAGRSHTTMSFNLYLVNKVHRSNEQRNVLLQIFNYIAC